MDYDTYDPKTCVILWRRVLNDAVVYPWQKLEGVWLHTDEGLRDWMEKENLDPANTEKWDVSKIERVGFQNDYRVGAENGGLRGYGLRLQFFIPKFGGALPISEEREA